MTLYERMLRHFGPQHWWPGESPLEIMIGAVLTQNTNWSNVERAIKNLRRDDLIDIEKLVKIDPSALAELIRPAGYFNIKAKRLKSLIDFVWREYEGDLDRFFNLPIDQLREKLLSVNGIGRETADDIVLYAAGKPTFVVDAYTYRIMVRHRLIAEDDDYEAIKEMFETHLPTDLALFNEYHALLVATGKNFCRKLARCEGCPLETLDHDPSLPSWG
jgi:endonuclease-3 related protein